MCKYHRWQYQYHKERDGIHSHDVPGYIRGRDRIRKLVYIRAVDDTGWIGSGIYGVQVW